MVTVPWERNKEGFAQYIICSAILLEESHCLRMAEDIFMENLELNQPLKEMMEGVIARDSDSKGTMEVLGIRSGQEKGRFKPLEKN